jgi:hypothetical protein
VTSASASPIRWSLSVRDLIHPVVDDDHGHRKRLVWLLLVPIALTAFVVSPPLGADGAAPKPVAATEPHKRPFPPLPPGHAPDVWHFPTC